MNTEEIRQVLQSDPFTAPISLGLFASDQLPFPIESRPSAFVANNHPLSKPGEHWVAFYVDDVVEYFDSYGLPPLDVFKKYLKKFSQVKHNTVTLQDFNSTVCGQYCIFFLHYRCRGYSMDEIVSFLNSKPNKNDDLVEDFVKYSSVSAENCQRCSRKCR